MPRFIINAMILNDFHAQQEIDFAAQTANRWVGSKPTPRAVARLRAARKNNGMVRTGNHVAFA